MNPPETDLPVEGCDGFDPQSKKLLPTSESESPLLVLREEIEIRKQQVVTGTVRIRKVVHEREECVEEPDPGDRAALAK